jgi:hypothetical protein
MMTNCEQTSSDEFFDRLRHRTALTVSSIHEMEALRGALHRGVTDLGVSVEFAPSTPERVVDWFGLTAAGTSSGALGGAALGLLVGALLERPVAGLLIGAGIGGIAGGMAGANAARQGWRLRFAWLPSGQPTAHLEPVG